MRYSRLLEIKRKLIIDYIKCWRHLDNDLISIPYSCSFESLRDTLKGIGETYEAVYEGLCKEKLRESEDCIDKMLLINSFANSNLTASDIAFVLGYDKNEVEQILSEYLNTNKDTK